MDEWKKSVAREMVERMSIPVTESGCWLWEGKGMYGRVIFDKKRMYAHRLAFLAYKGLIPSKKHIIHKCHNPCCVNPEHLILTSEAVKTGKYQ